MGPLSVSPMGFGTWAWGNQLLWGYQESMDDELQQIFNLAVENGVNLFDTADSYGTGKFNGQSEKLLGKFIREFQGFFSFFFNFTSFFVIFTSSRLHIVMCDCVYSVGVWKFNLCLIFNEAWLPFDSSYFFLFWLKSIKTQYLLISINGDSLKLVDLGG